MVAGLISSLILRYVALYAITAADTVDIKKPARGGVGVWGFVIASIVPRQLKARSLERALSRHTCVFASHDTLLLGFFDLVASRALQCVAKHSQTF